MRFAALHKRGDSMITAIVRYKLPASIDHDACLAHFVKIAPGFREAGPRSDCAVAFIFRTNFADNSIWLV